jgi:hypothetical protein
VERRFVAASTLDPRSTAPARAPRSPRRLLAPALRHPWALAGVLLPVASVLLLRFAGTRPGFDPYGWLTWGRQTLALNLDTNAAPAWKPLPWLFTVPYALAGRDELWLWMLTVLAVSLAGMVFAGRIVYRVLDPSPGRRWAAGLAAVAAGLAINLITQASPDYSIWHYILSAQSDPMIVALCLGATDCHLAGRERWALWLGVLAGLGRPEVWAILGPYGLWLWIRRPELRRMLLLAALVIVALWFGVPAISSRSPFVAAQNALHSPRRLAHDQLAGTIRRFIYLMPRGLEVVALLSVLLAVWRRDRVTLALAGIVVVWMAVEVGMVLYGWPGVPRYMFEPAALLAVIAGIGVGRLLSVVGRPVSARGLLAAAAAAAAVASVLPSAVSDARAEHRDLVIQRLRTHTLLLLGSEIAGYGGPGRFRACGEPLTGLQYQSALAWALSRNVASIGYRYGPAIASSRPIVLFTPYPQPGSGWQISAYRQRSTRFCRSLPRG